jgi:hypothetical protein
MICIARPPSTGRTHHQRQAEVGRHQARLLDRIGDAVLRLLQAQLVEHALEAVAVFGKVDGVGRGAEDRHIGGFQRVRQFQRGLAAELHDHAVQRAVLAFGGDFQHVFGGERFEIQPVRGVVVGRHGFRIAVDHDGFVAGVIQRKTGMAATIIELDARPMRFGPPPRMMTFFLSDGALSSARWPANGDS